MNFSTQIVFIAVAIGVGLYIAITSIKDKKRK